MATPSVRVSPCTGLLLWNATDAALVPGGPAEPAVGRVPCPAGSIRPTDEYPEFSLPAAVELVYAQSCRLELCRVARVGATGIGLGEGCRDNLVGHLPNRNSTVAVGVGLPAQGLFQVMAEDRLLENLRRPRHLAGGGRAEHEPVVVGHGFEVVFDAGGEVVEDYFAAPPGGGPARSRMSRRRRADARDRTSRTRDSGSQVAGSPGSASAGRICTVPPTVVRACALR